jgi:hypothetical protein
MVLDDLTLREQPPALIHVKKREIRRLTIIFSFLRDCSICISV